MIIDLIKKPIFFKCEYESESECEYEYEYECECL